MNVFAAPIMLLISMLLLLAGGVGLLEARSECTGLCFFADQVSAATTGLALVIVGLFNLGTALSLNNRAGADAVASSATATEGTANVYAELNQAHGVSSLAAEHAPPEPWVDKSPGARRS